MKRRPTRISRLAAVLLLYVVAGSAGSAPAETAEPLRIRSANGAVSLFAYDAAATDGAIALILRTPNVLSGDDAWTAAEAREVILRRIGRAVVPEMGENVELIQAVGHITIAAASPTERISALAVRLCSSLFAPIAVDEINRAEAHPFTTDSRFDRPGLDSASRIFLAAVGWTALPEPTFDGRKNDVAAYLGFAFHGANVTVSVCGKVSRDGARAVSAQLENLAPNPTGHLASALAIESFKQNYQWGNSAYALIAIQPPAPTDVDFPAFVVLNHVLGVGHASRLFRELRVRAAEGYDVGSMFHYEFGEPLIAYLQWDGRRSGADAALAARKLTALNAAIDSISTHPPTASEIARARNLALGREALRHERARDRTIGMAWFEAFGGGYAEDERLASQIAATTDNDVIQVAHKYLRRRANGTVTPLADVDGFTEWMKGAGPMQNGNAPNR